MENLVDSQHGSTSLLAGLIIVLVLHLLMKVADYVKEWLTKKGEHTDQNRVDIIKLEFHFQQIEKKLDEILKLKKDVKRAFMAIKVLSGEQWPDVRKKVMEDDFHG